MNSDTQRGWALIGARVRLQEIDKERAQILAAFPSLRYGSKATAATAASPAAASGKPRRKMSAAAKKAMSDGMRKYWARRKAAGK